MRKYLFIIMIAVGCLGVSAKGYLRWLQTEHDFGSFSEAERRVTCEMKAVNEGDSAVVIANVVTTCGCTTSDFTREAINPGDTATVAITYHATGRVGAFNKMTYVYTNTAQRRVGLRITGSVLASKETLSELYPFSAGELFVNKRSLLFGEMKKGASKISYIGAYNNSPDTLKVSFIGVPKHIEIEAYPPLVPPFGLCTISAFFNSFDTEQWGLNSDEFSIMAEPTGTSGDSVAGVLRIESAGTVEEDFSKLTPEQLQQAPVAVVNTETVDFGEITPSLGVATSTLKVGNSGKSELLIRRIYCTDKALKAVCKEDKVKAGRNVEVTLEVDPTQIPDRYLNTQLTVITNDPLHPKRIVRVVGIIKQEN